MNDPGKVVIVGAGPTGLGAAWRLHEAGHSDFVVLEAAEEPGGLASSFRDPQGFLWDVGGHVQFSHYRVYDEVLDRALGRDSWLLHDRESWVWIRERFVPYPFQYNLHRLDAPDRELALAGLRAAANESGERPPADFGEWVARTFGSGIADLFMRPYNLKVWGYPLAELDAGWIGERVAVPDLERVERGLREGRDQTSWGPNNRFRFPRQGGTGAIWKAVAAMLPAGRFRFGCSVAHLNATERRITTADGESIDYDRLVSTMPLDRLCGLCEGLEPRLRQAATGLRHSSSHILGVGLRGTKPEALTTKCWMYFPESNSPYYRVTVFSNYSPDNVPPVGEHWSLMAEVCETSHRPVDARALRVEVLRALREDGLIDARSEVVSFWHRREEHGYPTPFLGRDALLAALLPGLERLRIHSRGRFGAWRYEVSNQDHSFMQGVELVERLLGVGEEVTLFDPARANSGEFLRTESIASGNEIR